MHPVHLSGSATLALQRKKRLTAKAKPSPSCIVEGERRAQCGSGKPRGKQYFLPLEENFGRRGSTFTFSRDTVILPTSAFPSIVLAILHSPEKEKKVRVRLRSALSRGTVRNVLLRNKFFDYPFFPFPPKYSCNRVRKEDIQSWPPYQGPPSNTAVEIDGKEGMDVIL